MAVIFMSTFSFEKMKKRIRSLKDETGSVSILTIGLFTVTVALLILITDVAAISVSKQSLVHASESAAIRATQSLDLGSYYRGGSGVSVPIDCNISYQRVLEELHLWMQDSGSFRRKELKNISLTDFTCSGDKVRLSTSAEALLPFRLPQTSSSVEIHATVEAQSTRTR